MADSSWGPGWPNCQEEKWEFVAPKLTQTSFGRVRWELRELAERLIDESVMRGYIFRDGQCWGAVCREIRGSNPPVPSNHSWGLALDFNSIINFLGREDGGDIPNWMVELWGVYGFRWGGNFSGRKDPMHFEFLGSVEAAKKLTERARAQGLGEDRMTDQERQAFERLKEDVQELRAINAGMEKRLQGKPEPEGPGPQRAGWRRADRFLEEPKA